MQYASNLLFRTKPRYRGLRNALLGFRRMLSALGLETGAHGFGRYSNRGLLEKIDSAYSWVTVATRNVKDFEGQGAIIVDPWLG